MKKYYIILFLTLIVSAVSAQKKNWNMRNYMEEVLVTYPNHLYGVEYYSTLPRAQQNLLFSIIISVNAAGKVEKVDYTNKTSRADSIMRFSDLSAAIKADKRGVLKLHKKSVVIIPVWLRKMGEVYIETGVDFIKSFDELLPDANQFPKNYRIIYLPTLRFNRGDLQS